MSKQTMSFKPSDHERENDGLRWVKIVRSCDDPHKAFARNRVVKQKQQTEETK